MLSDLASPPLPFPQRNLRTNGSSGLKLQEMYILNMEHGSRFLAIIGPGQQTPIAPVGLPALHCVAPHRVPMDEIRVEQQFSILSDHLERGELSLYKDGFSLDS